MHGLLLWNTKKILKLLNLLKKLDESNRKLNTIWVDRGSRFYNGSMKLWLQDNDIEMYSTHKERKSVATGKFVRNLKINEAWGCKV